MQNIVGLRELRQNMDKYSRKVAKGNSFIVFRRAKPLFQINPIEKDQWEEVIDFTKIKKGGVKISEILSRL